jgi:tetrahydromethanopterin S-methyltransferase subunit D
VFDYFRAATFCRYYSSYAGAFVFCIFVAGNLLQIYDVVCVLMKAVKQTNFTTSNKFRHFLTIGTFLLGLGVYVFSVMVIEDITYSHFGACFYIALVSLLLLILTIIYERESMRRMANQAMLTKLLEDQRRI